MILKCIEGKYFHPVVWAIRHTSLMHSEIVILFHCFLCLLVFFGILIMLWSFPLQSFKNTQKLMFAINPKQITLTILFIIWKYYITQVFCLGGKFFLDRQNSPRFMEKQNQKGQIRGYFPIPLIPLFLDLKLLQLRLLCI